MGKSEEVRYKSIRSEVEGASDRVFEDDAEARRILCLMFGFDVFRELQPDEIKQLQTFVKHAGKRLINAALHSPVRQARDTQEAIEWLSPEGHFPFYSRYQWFHDLTHVFVAADRDQDKNSIVPAFLTAHDKPINNRDLIEDEIVAHLWGSYYGSKPLFILLMSEDGRRDFMEDFRDKRSHSADEFQRYIDEVDDSSFESVFRVYLKIMLRLTKVFTRDEYCKIHGGDISDTLASVDPDYDKIADKILNDPPARLKELARRIYDEYPSNPKILWDLFIEICGPLIQRLEQREETS